MSKLKVFMFWLGISFIIILTLSSINSKSHHNRISNSIGIKIPSNFKIEYEDTHGGFHGDGAILSKVQMKGKDSDKMLSEIKNKWNSLPLTGNLNLIMYGGKKDNIDYMYNFAQKLEITHIENGYWYFADRHSKTTDAYDDKDLLNRHSLNFTLAIYDADTSVLYYLEFDT